MAVGLFLTAVQTYVLQRSAQDLQQVYSWLLGSLSGATWQQAGEILPYSAVSVAVVLLHGRHLDVLSVGDEEARALGLHPGRTRLIVVAACSLAAASAVAVSGLIGFVGIVVPHVVRGWPGPAIAWCCRCRCWPAAGSWSWPTPWPAPSCRPPSCPSAWSPRWSARRCSSGSCTSTRAVRT